MTYMVEMGLPDLAKYEWALAHYRRRRWCRANCEGKFKLMDSHVFFEQENDAMLYKLMWS